MAQRIVAWILGGGLIGVAALMLVSPATWYENHPGVADHGPLNVHFVRDIGCANLVAGAAIVFAILIPGKARTLLAGATVFCRFMPAFTWLNGSLTTAILRSLSARPQPYTCLCSC